MEVALKTSRAKEMKFEPAISHPIFLPQNETYVTYEINDMAVCIAVIGKEVFGISPLVELTTCYIIDRKEVCCKMNHLLQNFPLFLRTVVPEEELKFHYTVHTSLDVVEEKGAIHLFFDAHPCSGFKTVASLSLFSEYPVHEPEFF